MVRSAFFLLIISLVSVVSSQARAEDWLGGVYQTTHEWANWVNCPDATVKELELFQGPNCRHGAITQLHSALRAQEASREIDSEIVAKEFFNHGAMKQVDSFKCQLAKHTAMTDGSATSNAVIEGAAKDLNHKLPLLRQLDSEIKALTKRKAELKSSFESLNAYSGVDYPKKIMAEQKATDQQLARLNVQFAGAMQTNPLGSFTAGGKLIERMIAAPGNMFVTTKGVTDAYRTERDQVAKDLKWLSDKRVSKDSFSLKRTDREWLLTHGEAETWVDASKAKSPALQGLMCRMNGAYGEGVQEFQTAMFMGSFALWGAGLAIKGFQGVKIAATAMGLRTSAVPVIGNYMIASSYVPTFAYGLKNVESKCHGFGSDMGKYTSSCEIPPGKEIEVMVQRNCRYAQLMLAGNAVFAVGMSPAVKATATRLATKLYPAKSN